MSIEAAQAYICTHQNLAIADVDNTVGVVCSMRAGSQQNCYEQGGAGDLGFTSGEFRQALVLARGSETTSSGLLNNVGRFCATSRPPEKIGIGGGLLIVAGVAVFIAAPFLLIAVATSSFVFAVVPREAENVA